MGMRTPLIKITNDGAICMKLTNKSGGTLNQGEIVEASSSTDMAVDDAGANDAMPIGTCYDATIADNAAGWIGILAAIPAKADAGGFLRGEWAGTGASAKLVDGDAATPAATQHFQEVGHPLEAATDGQVRRIIAHFN